MDFNEFAIVLPEYYDIHYKLKNINCMIVLLNS